MLTVAAVAGLTGVATADAHTFKSSVTIDDFYCGSSGPTPPCTFVGHVSSPRAKCRRDRTVKLFFGSNPPDLIGSDHTSRNGFWGVTVPQSDLRAGFYHATAKRRVLKNGDVCKRARSADYGLM